MPGDYRIAHISFSERRRRECNLRREQYGEGQLTTVYHLIKPEPVTRGNVENLRESLCGIVPRWYGFGNAPGSQPYQPNILERLALEAGDHVPDLKKKMRRPKEWVYDDIHDDDQPVTCRYCLTLLKREQPTTVPVLRRRPSKEAKPPKKKLSRELRLAHRRAAKAEADAARVKPYTPPEPMSPPVQVKPPPAMKPTFLSKPKVAPATEDNV